MGRVVEGSTGSSPREVVGRVVEGSQRVRGSSRGREDHREIEVSSRRGVEGSQREGSRVVEGSRVEERRGGSREDALCEVFDPNPWLAISCLYIKCHML